MYGSRLEPSAWNGPPFPWPLAGRKCIGPQWVVGFFTLAFPLILARSGATRRELPLAERVNPAQSHAYPLAFFFSRVVSKPLQAHRNSFFFCFAYAHLGRPPFLGFLLRTTIGLSAFPSRHHLFWFALGRRVRVF